MYRMKRIDTCTHTRQRLRRAHHRSHTHTRFHRIVCNINRSQSIQFLYYYHPLVGSIQAWENKKKHGSPEILFFGGVSVAAWTCEHRSLSYNKRRSSTGRVAFGNRIASSTSNGKKRKKKSFFFLVEEKGTKRKFILTFILLKVCCVELLFPGISPPLDDYVYWSWAFFSFLYTLVNQESSTQTLTA